MPARSSSPTSEGPSSSSRTVHPVRPVRRLRGGGKRRGVVTPMRAAMAGALTAVLGVSLIPAAAAAPPAAPEVVQDLTAKAAAQAQAAVTKGLDKGPGAKAPQGAPYTKQQQALAAAAAVRQSGPKLGSKDTEPVEVVAARTRTSRTVQDPITGIMTTQFSTESLNYQDTDGTWQPIDSALKAAGKAADGSPAAWVNGDNRFDASFPTSLADGPVSLTDTADKNRSVSLRLLPPGPAAPVKAPTSSGAPSASSAASSAPNSAASAVAASAAATSSSAAPTSAAIKTSAAAGLLAAVNNAVGVVEGDEVTYPDAAGAGLDVAYEAGADSVKETITLDSPAAAATLAAAGGSVSFALTVGKGLTPKLTDTLPEAPGGEQIEVTDAKGGLAYVIPPAFMDDAKGVHSTAVAYTLTPATAADDPAKVAGGAWTLTLTPDAEWLAAKDRTYPVVVDPTITTSNPSLACGLYSQFPTTVSCSSATMPLSWSSQNGNQRRMTLRFDDLLNVVPADTDIHTARLKVHVQTNGSSTTNTGVDVRELTAPFTNQATWNTRNGSTAWTTPGGDFATLVSSRKQLPPGGYRDLDVAELVSRWVTGDSAYHGFILSKTTANNDGSGGQMLLSGPVSGNAPSLYLEWEPRTGQRKADESVANIEVTDRTKVSVNPATGNATVATSEFSLNGVGLDLQVGHTSNSLFTGRLGPYGYGWVSSVGGAGASALRIINTDDNHVQFFDATGATWAFYRAIDGTYIRPPGLDVDLTRNTGNDTWTITDRFNKVAQTFTKISTSSGLQNFYGLSSVVDRNGNTITYTYDASATVPYLGVRILRSVTDTRGRVFTITNPGSFATAATDSANRSVYYTVASNQLTEFKDANGNITKYGYDSGNRVTLITTAEGRKVTLAYDSGGRVTRIVNSNGSTDSNGNLAGPTWTFGYSAYTRTATGAAATTTTVTDPNGQSSSYISDGNGRVSKETDPRNKSTLTTYDNNDEVLTTTDATPTASGGVATYTSTYSAGSYTLSSRRVPTGAGTALTYGTGARLYDPVTATDARGNQETYGYDTNGNPTTTTRGGVTTTNLYQGSTDPAYGGVVNCGPMVNGVVTATKVGVLCESRDGAYVNGSSAATTTAHRTLYRYNALGEMVSSTPPSPSAQTQQSYRYDSLSRVTHVTDGKGQTTIYGYDALDRQTYMMYPDGSSQSRYITADGPLRSETEYNSSGAATRYVEHQRDTLNRLVRLVTPEGDTTLSYDSFGLLRSYNDGAGVITYDYNAAAQLVSLAEPGGSCAGQTFATPGAASTKCTLFQLNDDGDRTAIRYPGGQTLTYTLDDAKRIARITGKTSADNGSSSVTQLDLTLGYSSAAAPATSTNPNKDTGTITSITDTVTSRKTAYTYDSLDRLTVADTAPVGGGASTDYEAFCYDGAGNRTKYYTSTGATCSSSNPTVSYTYNGANEMTDAIPGTGSPSLTGSGFAYDANGNQTSAKSLPGRSVTYSDRDSAIATTPSGAAPVTATYAANGNWDRLSNGTETFQSSLLSPAPARSTVGQVTTWAIRDPQGQLIAVRQGSTSAGASATSYYPFVDQVESVRTLVTASGSIAATYSYSAFGVARGRSGTLTQPYQYGAGYADSATGLIKLGMRYYDPSHGRFTQPDPTGQEGNEYLYANGDPIMLNDPQGDVAPIVWVAVVGGIRLAPHAIRAAKHIVRAAAPVVRKVGHYINNNNYLRVGPKHGEWRVSFGPAPNHFKRLSPGAQSVQRWHGHFSRSYGGFYNNKTTKRYPIWGRR